MGCELWPVPQWRPSLEGPAFSARSTINISPFYRQETVVKKTRLCVQGHIDQNCSCLGLSTSRSPSPGKSPKGKVVLKCSPTNQRRHQTLLGLPNKPFSLQKK